MGLPQSSALSFSERLVKQRDRIDYRRADSSHVREEIYQLRHDAYVKEGMISANRRARLSDDFDEAKNSWIFGLYVEDSLVASIRINVASATHGPSPATGFFPDLLEPEMQAGRIVVDPNRLVTDQAAARLIPELAYLTVRLGYVAEQHFAADMVTATVRAEHQAFYKRVFNLRPECLPRVVPPIQKPFCLMSSRGASASAIMARYPCFRSTEAERTSLFGRGAGMEPLAFTPRPAERPLAAMHA